MASEEFQEISAADFFWRNRDIAGFTNPGRAVYTTIRELLENSMDAAESAGILPNIYVRLREVEEGVYEVVAADNGRGVPAEKIAPAFGQILFGSKYKLRQTRGAFGLGGKMAILYGQITTNKPARVVSSTGGSRIHNYLLNIDIKHNKPKILKHKVTANSRKWHGTIVELMCGRTIGVTQSYLKPEESKIKEYYANAMQRTVLSETQINATRRILTLEEENKELKERLSELESGKVKRKQEEEIAKLQERLARLESIYTEKVRIRGTATKRKPK